MTVGSPTTAASVLFDELLDANALVLLIDDGAEYQISAEFQL